MSDQALTRNFCIIAHVDHGKTTLSDRLLQATNTISDRQMTAQHLDSMDLERERGITIKAHPVTMSYKARNGTTYQLNLIDTPGHVDFAYEVSRSLSACDGALLIIDAAQGVEAQTVANVHLANKQNLKLIPVINKIDLPSADVETTKRQLEDVLSIPADEAILASAKNGIGIGEILEAIIERIPPPRTYGDDYTRALVFDSLFDTYRGVVTYVRTFSGELKSGTPILLMGSNLKYDIKEVGIFTPKPIRTEALKAGHVGYLIANIKTTAEVKIGDTITNAQKPAPKPLPGFKTLTPMVFSGIYPIDTSEFEQLKIALGKLQLNDPALTYTTESSVALGFGFRCGFLGLLHMEIVQERLRREYQMDIIATYPSVVYEVTRTNGEVLMIDNPTKMPDPSVIEHIAEPMVRAFIMVPNDNIGDIMQLVMEKRGICEHTESLDAKRIMLRCDLPLNEILVDFNDRIKSITRGYGSMDYEYAPYRISDMVKMDMLVNAEPVDAFSCIVERSKAEARGRHIAAKLKEVIHPHLFKIAIQAAIGGKIIAREDVKSVGKNVTAKCYGGDITRKRKLLEKQKEGKKRMKSIGQVDIPQEAFIAVLKSENK
ncbi:MAG: translation elongation factor 4 [Methylacidiphilales bacterium]|nr:translation elongation factor 4 [Candidatus Methylacidiphilales bacterium]